MNLNFSDILSKYNIEIAPEGQDHTSPGWIHFDCPFCEKDAKRFHMGYSLENNFTNCWQCGYHSLLSTLVELTDLSFYECKKLLKNLDTEHFEIITTKGKLVIPNGVEELKRVHKKYLRKRNFDIKPTQKTWEIKGIGIHATLSWRLFIPIHYQGKIVSWTTRSVWEDVPKRYITARKEEEEISAKSLLYGEDYCKDTIIVCEGPLDVWRIGAGAVATMGTAYSQAQVEKIVKYKKRAICFDNDKAGQAAAKRLCSDISSFPGKTFNIVLDRKDAAESSDKVIWKLRKFLL